jgi:hypothetical protein
MRNTFLNKRESFLVEGDVEMWTNITRSHPSFPVNRMWIPDVDKK